MLVTGFVAGCLAVVVYSAYRAGAFSQPEFSREQRGPYTVACMAHNAPYDELGKTIREVRVRLERAGATRGRPCGIFYGEPVGDAEGELRARAGYVVGEGFEPDEPLDVVTIPRRDVLRVTFEGQPTVAAGRIYPRAAEWLAERELRRGYPGVEFYRERMVEAEIPIAGAEQE